MTSQVSSINRIARRDQQERRLARTLRRRRHARRADRPLGIVATAGEGPAAAQAITAACRRRRVDGSVRSAQRGLPGCCPTRRAGLPPGTAQRTIGAPRAGRTPRRWRRTPPPCPSSRRRGPRILARSRRTGRLHQPVEAGLPQLLDGLVRNRCGRARTPAALLRIVGSSALTAALTAPGDGSARRADDSSCTISCIPLSSRVPHGFSC